MWNSNVSRENALYPSDGISEPEDMNERMNSFMGGPPSMISKGLADDENYANFNSYIKESLDRLGVDSYGPIDFASNNPDLNANCVNSVLDLLKLAEQSLNRCEKNKDEIWTLNSQIKDYETNIRSMKGGISEVQDELRDVRVKYRAAEKAWNEKEQEMSLRMKELEKQCRMVQNRDKQYVHSMRKLEQQIQKLKTSCNKELYESAKTAGVYFKVHNPLRKASRIPLNAKKENNPVNVEFLNDVIETYRQRTRAVELENYSLRSELKKFQERFIEMLLADTEGIEDVEIPSLPEDAFSMPIDDLKAPLEDAMRGIHQIVKERLTQDESTSTIEKARMAIDEQKKIIERQHRIIESVIYDPLKEMLAEHQLEHLAPL